jgi:hypothetical protein
MSTRNSVSFRSLKCTFPSKQSQSSVFLLGAVPSSCLVSLTVYRRCQYRIDYRTINECVGVGGIKIGQGNRNTQRKPAPNATLSTTHPTWLYLGSNPGRRGGKPATTRQSQGTAPCACVWCWLLLISICNYVMEEYSGYLGAAPNSLTALVFLQPYIQVGHEMSYHLFYI